MQGCDLNREKTDLLMTCTSISCTALVQTKRKPTANLRELTRIAFSLRSGTLLRLIAYAGIAPSLEKCYRKNPPAGFSVVSLYFQLHKKEKVTKRKTGTPVFPQHFSRRRAIPA
ncbi:hypothetical protein Mlab_1171 [Methanocorpusculum labreanum Z]|uniref:Uncharacterized protein n=1 Tax=Methanocorpusculum labreanum (strain ATCC 43576 / DSM 4855 / Z) TaxID=410358 RepID=A2SSN4_METLZ|nr:hypothetical protein Mlab_1171 [Methanocorpusculum labreanum Z]